MDNLGNGIHLSGIKMENCKTGITIKGKEEVNITLKNVEMDNVDKEVIVNGVEKSIKEFEDETNRQ